MCEHLLIQSRQIQKWMCDVGVICFGISGEI
jgi:hypothetical protein